MGDAQNFWRDALEGEVLPAEVINRLQHMLSPVSDQSSLRFIETGRLGEAFIYQQLISSIKSNQVYYAFNAWHL
ncbi:unnamed protein product [Protopolystoma xenopodis]|uniref:Uncharacterized protein n=1 Tax=Protopolystoma xenopodis TaxID=117903 RepID=A0A3S5AW33_9PLAT|nr:unnamed protein product [Protopolystoma xenopodis]